MIIDATFWVAVSFFIFIGVLIYFKIPKKINDALSENINTIKDDLDEAQKLKSIAEEKLKEYEITIENAKKDVLKIIFKSKKKLSSEIQNKKKEFEKEIELEVKSAELEIKNLKSESLANISTISEEMTSKIIEMVSGVPLNQSSIKAAVLESTKKNLGKYL